MQLLTSIAGRTLRVLLALALAGVLVFFALTRTQVGRDELRREVERRFSADLQGDLRIRELKGNLVNDLFASDVRLYDPDGNLVLSVDSAVVRPRWRDLFRRTVSVGQVTLYRPEFHFIREADGTWTFPKSFQPRIRGTAASRPWSFNSTGVRIVDGSVRTSNRGALPDAVANGTVFNYADTRIEHLDAAATVEWRPQTKQIEVLRADADWPERGLSIDRLQGQLVLDGGNLAVNEFELHAGSTVLSATGTVAPLRYLGTDSLGHAAVALRLRPSHVDNGDLRRFFPSLPLADAVDVEGHVRGPLSALVVETIRLERGQTVVEAKGTLAGLPERLDFDVSVAPSTVHAADLLAVLPDADLPDLRHLGRVSLDLSANGMVPLAGSDSSDAGRVATSFSLKSPAGAASGKMEARHLTSRTPSYTANLRVQRLDVGRVAQRAALQSQLTGTVRVRGTGVRWDSLRGQVQVSLNPSQFAGRQIDTLFVTADVAEQAVQAFTYAAQGAGSLHARGALDLKPVLPTYRLEAATRRLNVGALLGSDSLWTNLDTDIHLTGAGLSPADVNGQFDLVFDSSEVRVGTRHRLVPPNRTTLTLAPAGSAEPRVVLSGDALTLRLEGNPEPEPLIALARLWGAAFAESIRRETDKPIDGARLGPGLLYAAAVDSTLLEFPEKTALRELVRRRLRYAGHHDGLSFTADVDVHRPDLLAALVPVLPDLKTDLQGRLDVQANADRLTIRGTLAADSLESPTVRTSGLHATLDVEGDLDATLERSLAIALDADADSLHVSAQTFVSPNLSFRFHQRAGQVSLTTQGSERTGPLQLTAALDLLPDRNRLTLFNLRVSAGNYEWTNAGDQPIDLYSDAVDIPGLTLESRARDSELVQKIHVHGTVSPSPRHVLYADIENVSLKQLTGLTRLKKPLRGLARGQLALSGGIRKPELTGQIEIPVLAYGNDILGRLNVTSRFVPGSPDVALDVTLEPAGPPEEAAALLINGERPAGNVTGRENALHLGGTFRLPEIRGGRLAGDPGAFNLTLDVDRADLFFMEDIFPEVIARVEGYAEGGGTIGGTFLKPQPDLRLRIRDGRFRIPEFNLAYTAEGPVRIDTEGIKLDGAMVTDGSDGTADLTGTIRFNDYKYFSFDLAGKLDELRIMNVMQSNDLPFYGRIWATGNATLTGPVYKATLSSPNATTSPESEVFIPLTETGATVDPGFIVFADSTGKIPDLRKLSRRENLLSRRPTGERTFLDGLEMDLNIFAPPGSTVHLVIDPLLGDVINAVGTGRIQLQRTEGEFFTYGALNVTAGDYLFTAGDVFFRRFLIDEGTILYDGDPTDALLDISASYRTRASGAGLPLDGSSNTLIPVVVGLDITGRLSTPAVNLNLAVDRRDRDVIGSYEGLEATLNQPDRATEYATSVLLTNSFLLTTSGIESVDRARTNTNQFAFNSLSQLVASQLNRYLNQAVPNLDLNFGVATGERAQDLDITYGVALRLLDERLVIRGQGVYQGDQAKANRGEFVVEVRLSPNVAVEVFYRREGDILSETTLTNTTGAGLSYQTQFSTWRRLVDRLFGWMTPDEEATPGADTASAAEPS